MEMKVKRKINPWSQRTIISLPPRQYKKLLSKGKCKTVQNYQWYIIQREPDFADVELFDKSGNKISLSVLKKMLRKAK